MRVDDMPLMSLLKGRLTYLNQRESLIAQNVANADTSGFTPQDLKPFDAASALQGGAPKGGRLALSVSEAGHLPGTTSAAAGYAAQAAPDSETKLNGNSVTVEDEMMKMAESRMDYDAAISFYQKALSMIRTAAKKPGS